MAQAVVDRQTMNIADMAKVLGISRAVAYSLAQRDELPVPVIRLGRRMVVSRRAVEALLDRTEIDDEQQAA